MKKIFYTIFIALFTQITTPSEAQTLSGYVLDTEGDPLPGTNIYIDKTNRGTMSNSEGYYVLKLPEGRNTVVFSFIGYRNDTLIVDAGPEDKIKKNITLNQYAITGEEILVFASQYNDAQEIVWKTIQNKNEYLSSIKNYQYDAYHKTVFKLDIQNKRIIGGILETNSRGYFKSPDRFQEIILNKKQTRNFSDVTNVFSVGKIPNLLEDELIFDELSVISPLSRQALDYYNYTMQDTTYFNGRRVFNMTFGPKHANLPLFSGKMSIIDKDFAVVSSSVSGGKRIVTQLRDSIEIRQKFRQFEEKYWFSTEIVMDSRVNLNIPAIPMLYWHQYALISNYEINDPEFDHVFDNRTLSFDMVDEEESNQLWQRGQAIPLNAREIAAARRIDSTITNINFVKKSVLTLIQNFDKILITGFYDFYHYNRVEGNYFGIGFDSKRKLSNKRVRLKSGYGNKDSKFKYDIDYKHDLIPKQLEAQIQVFDRLSFLDQFYRYNPTDITLQTLTGKNDYADYFYERGARLGFEVKLFEHLKFGSAYIHSTQSDAPNLTTWAPLNNDKTFRPAFDIDDGTVSAIELNLVSDNLKFFDLGWVMVPDLSQEFFDINIKAKISSEKTLNSSFDFQQYYLSLNSLKKFPPYIHFYFRISAGLLKGDKPDQMLFHFGGAYGSFGNPILFRTINSDIYIGDRFLTLSLENNFKNTLFALFHLPYLKNSKLDFLIFANLGWMRNDFIPQAIAGEQTVAHPLYNQIQIKNRPLTEIGLSIGNIFTFMRVDFTNRLNYNNGNNFNVRLTSRLFIR